MSLSVSCSSKASHSLASSKFSRLQCHAAPFKTPAAVAASMQRRDVLLGLTASSWLAQELGAWAKVDTDQCAQADTEELSDVCRRAGLGADGGATGNYSNLSDRKFALAGGVPVASLGSQYATDTLKLMDDIQQYTSMDVYEKGRVAFIKQLKQDGLAWVSTYARGGSVRSRSARSMYTAVDAVLGHLAANGLAPLPGKKAQTVLDKLDTTKQFLLEGQ